MRNVGVVLVALGIVTMLFAMFPLLDNQVRLSLGCLVFVAIPMFVTGILIVRRYEDRRQAAEVPVDPDDTGGDEPRGGAATDPDEPATLPDAISGFDLNRLNWRGWVLLLATGAFVMGQVPLIVLVTEAINPKHRKLAVTLLAAVAVYLG